MLRKWMEKYAGLNKEQLELFCPYHSGKQILSIAESDFILCLLDCKPKMSEKQAIQVY
jgi:hypothetical protein